MGNNQGAYLLQCHICGKKMWLKGARQHRDAKHRDVSWTDFQDKMVLAVRTGEITVRKFEPANPNLVSGTQRIRASSKFDKRILSIVSGGSVP